MKKPSYAICPNCNYEQLITNLSRLVCGNCGRLIPVPKQANKEFTTAIGGVSDIIKVLAGLALVVFVIVKFNTCGQSDNDSPNSFPHSTSSENRVAANARPSESEAFIISTNFVKDYLKAPSTADFPAEAISVKSIGDTFMVYAFVDAENSFGAALRQKYLCELNFKGGNWANQANWNLQLLTLEDDVLYVNKDRIPEDVLS